MPPSPVGYKALPFPFRNPPELLREKLFLNVRRDVIREQQFFPKSRLAQKNFTEFARALNAKFGEKGILEQLFRML